MNRWPHHSRASFGRIVAVFLATKTTTTAAATATAATATAATATDNTVDQHLQLNSARLQRQQQFSTETRSAILLSTSDNGNNFNFP